MIELINQHPKVFCGLVIVAMFIIWDIATSLIYSQSKNNEE